MKIRPTVVGGGNNDKEVSDRGKGSEWEEGTLKTVQSGRR
jgi:hypothetical protein